MDKRAVLALVIVILLQVIPLGKFHVLAEADAIEVPIDFPTIQAAIDNANDGDTIFIHEGTYMENVVVNRTLLILGESSTRTVIDGNKSGTTLTIFSDNVIVQNVTIKGGGPNAYESGIHIAGSYCDLADNFIISNDVYGIYLDSSFNTTISDNIIEGNGADGIVLFGSANNTISTNIIQNNRYGIHLYSSVQNSIFNNTSTENSHAGIGLLYSSDNLVADNNVTGNTGQGIVLEFSSNTNRLTGNAVARTQGYGIMLASSSGNVLRNNHLSNNTYNLYLPAAQPTLSDFLNDIDTSNTIDGKPVYYLVNREGTVVDQSTAPNAGYLALINCTWMIVRNLTLSRNGQGLLLAFTHHSVITQLNLSDNANGVQLLAADDNAITNSTVMRNLDYGVSLDYLSSENLVACNTIANSSNAVKIEHQYTDANQVLNNLIVNNQKGFWINSFVQENIIAENTLVNNSLAIDMRRASTKNTLTRNMIANNTQGINIDYCYNNSIFSNNFVDNAFSAVSNNSENYWDNGQREGGNFWSDYNGVDQNADGIGDVPYIVERDNADRYPLMGMFYEFEVSNQQEQIGNIRIVSNSTISNFTFTIQENSSSPTQAAQEYILFLATGDNNTDGFCRANIPRNMMNGPYTVLVDGKEAEARELAISDATQAYLYFVYRHSTREVTIIPELPLAIVSMIFFLAVSIFAIFRKKISEK